MKKFLPGLKKCGKVAANALVTVAFGMLDAFFDALDGAADMCSLR